MGLPVADTAGGAARPLLCRRAGVSPGRAGVVARDGRIHAQCHVAGTGEARFQGRNLIVDERAGGADAVERLARELVQDKPDAIIAIGGDAIGAASRATSTVPIVVFGALPRGEAAPASLARPGGNVTGVVILGPELDGKRLELLHEAVPGARRVAGLFVPWA